MKKQLLSLLAAGLMLGEASQVRAMDPATIYLVAQKAASITSHIISHIKKTTEAKRCANNYNRFMEEAGRCFFDPQSNDQGVTFQAVINKENDVLGFKIVQRTPAAPPFQNDSMPRRSDLGLFQPLIEPTQDEMRNNNLNAYLTRVSTQGDRLVREAMSSAFSVQNEESINDI